MKALKIILIVLFALLFAASGGLLVYAAMQGPTKTFEDDSADYSVPAAGLYLGDYADQQIDISAIKNDTSLSGKAERVAKMIINASYNNIIINQFYFKASVDIEPVQSSNKYVKSEYFRAKNGANMFYHYHTYTGDINVAEARIDYIDERVQAKTMSNVNYNRITGEWTYGLNNVKESTHDVSLPEPTPYNIYSWYDFPIDLGGIKSCNGNSGRTADIDYSLIDEKSVVIEEKVDENNNAYYRINFKAIIAKAMASAETKDRFSDSFNSLSNVDFSELAFEVDIWKDAGVFRKIGFNAHVTASMGNNRGEVEIEKVNKAFIGAKITKGEHNIRITYQSPWLNYGIISSGIGLLLLLGIFIYDKKKKISI